RAGVGQRQRLQRHDAEQADGNDQQRHQHLDEAETRLTQTRLHSQLPSPSPSGFETVTRLPDAMFSRRLFSGGLVVSMHTLIWPDARVCVPGWRARPSAPKVTIFRFVLTTTDSGTERMRSCCWPPPDVGPITTQKGCWPSEQSSSPSASALL